MAYVYEKIAGEYDAKALQICECDSVSERSNSIVSGLNCKQCVELKNQERPWIEEDDESYGENGFASCGADPDCVLTVQSTTLIALILCGTLTGIAMYIIGNRRLGSLISFVPFPVQCSFLAACGFKIFKAGLYLMMTPSDINADVESVKQFFFSLLPVFFMAIFIMWAEHHFHHSRFGQWVLPGILLFLSSLFYIVLGVYSFTNGIDYIDAIDMCTQSNNSIAPLPDDRVWLMKTEMEVKWNEHFTVAVRLSSPFVSLLSPSPLSSVLEHKLPFVPSV
eukprot:SAG31_NODE_2529_length_5556_cov_114.211472_7_plen_279_part_00